MAGYSGTPLAKKLGITPGSTVTTVHSPPDFIGLLTDLPDGVSFETGPSSRADLTIAFFTDADALRSELDALAQAIFPDRTLWLAWPKKTSGVETNLSGNVVRAAVLETTLVDVKVCAISSIWSGLKVVWRKEHR